MKPYRILSATGADRPGIVHDVSEYLFSHGCNIEDSRMAVLGDQFTLMTLFSGEAEGLEQLEQGLSAFQERAKLSAQLTKAVAPHEYQRVPSLPVRLEVVAMDAPGIMVQLADVLHGYRVNIETLDSHISPAPTSGSTVFSIKMKVTVPQDVSLNEVKNALNNLAGRINLDVLFQPVHE
jgi:glycine cleavage system transcriptional repressor